jgi:peptidoglycan hydrolase FlgJ
MMKIGGPAPSAPITAPNAAPADPVAAARDAKLHKVSTQLEGLFVQQMYKSMRSTVPTDGMFDGGSGEQLFTGLLDDHIAADTPHEWKHGLSESIYRQLKEAITAQGSNSSSQSNPLMPAGVDK